jgi:ATP-dependent DNA ligase
MRKANLARLLARRPDGIFLSDFEQGSPDWLHEIKYDGYRLRLERDGRGVRLITGGGYNFADRYPWIVEAARKVRQAHFVIDGEAVVLGVDGVCLPVVHLLGRVGLRGRRS